MKSSTDNRLVGRASLLLDVKYEGAGVRAENRISDISTTGIFIDAISPLPKGANLTLTFTLPNGRVVKAEGRVAHCQPRIGMGVEFTRLTAEDALAISEAVNQ